MEAIRIHQLVKVDGEVEISLTGLPVSKGQELEVILLIQPLAKSEKLPLTADRLMGSGLVGSWKERTDLDDSVEFARQLRNQSQTR